MAAQQKGDYATSAREYERALALAPRVFGANDQNTATIINNLAAQYLSLGRYDRAEPLLKRALAIGEAKLGANHLDVARGLNNLAELYRVMGENAKAEPLYLRSLKIYEAKRGRDHPDTSATVNNLATLYQAMGRYARALPLFERSLQIKQAKLGPDHPDVALALNNLAELYRTMGEYARAKPLYERSLRIWEMKLGRDHPNTSVAVNNLAALYQAMGQYAQALPLFQRGLRIKEATLGPDHPDVALAMNNLALIYDNMGQYADAQSLYERSLKISEAKLGRDHLQVAATVENLAGVYLTLEKYAQAEPLFLRGLKIKEARLGPDHPDVAVTLNSLALLYNDMGQYAEAEGLHQRGLRIREAKLGPDHPDVAASLNNLGFLYVDMRQYPKAEPLYVRSLKIKQAGLAAEHPDIALAFSNLARLAQAMGETEKAADNMDRNRRAVRSHVARVLTVLSAQQQITFIERTDEGWFHSALTLGMLHADDAAVAERSAGWLVNGKAVIQESLAEGALLARDSQDAKLAAQIKQLLSTRKELAALNLAVPEPGKEAAHRQRLAELAAREQELARQVNMSVGRPARNAPWIEAAAVRKALAPDAVLVEIARFLPYVFGSKSNENHWRPARYAAWVIPPAGQGNVRIVDLGQAVEVDRAVATARMAIEQSVAEIKRAEDDEQRADFAAQKPLTALAKLVLQPLLPAIGDARELVLSPDSQLWLAPWAALPVEDGNYAIERWRLRYVTSGRDVVATASGAAGKQTKPTRPRIFADPDYDLDGKGSESATRAALRGKEKQLAMRGAVGLSQSGLPRFERLPATAEEARLITPSLAALAHEAPTVYSRQYALEGVLKVIQSPRVLVLSTHGFYLPDQVAEKDGERGVMEVELAAGRPGTAAPRRSAPLLATDGKPVENPLLRCGLLLAGCNRRQRAAAVDDGVVTGMEILGCDFRGTELVVLSACETGLGQVRNGEGVASLRQAFQLAGAKAVVSTLWRIPDEETVTLMDGFFSHLAAGESKAEALRNAQLAQITARRRANGAAHPYYWAAFTVTGH